MPEKKKITPAAPEAKSATKSGSDKAAARVSKKQVRKVTKRQQKRVVKKAIK